MDKSDLLKIAYAAIIAVVFKEFLSWLISRSKPLAAMAARISGKWVSRHIYAIEFGVDIGVLVLFSELFYIFPYDETTVTYAAIKIQILMGVLIGLQFQTSVYALKRWISHKKALDF